jgi:PAS domain S-box-containing protein
VAAVLSPAEYRALVDHSPVMIWRSGTDARCDYFNDTWLAFTGRTLEQELGDGWAEGVHPDDLAPCVQRYLDCFARRESFEMEYRLRRHDGAYRYIFDRGTPLYGEGGEFCGFIGSCVDVDDRRRAQAQRAQISEQRLELALSAARLGAWQLMLPGRTLTASEQCLANHGLPPDAHLDLQAVIDSIEEPARVGFVETIERAVATGGGFEVEVPNRWPDGSLHWLLISGRMIDTDCLAGVTQDVSARRAMEQQLRDADQRKDEFLAILSHELRNPLASIMAATRVLQLRGPEDAALARARNAIMRQAMQVRRLVDDLLEIGRIKAGKVLLEKVPADLDTLLSQAVESCQPGIDQRRHRLEVVRGGALPVEVDPRRIVQVICNLLSNAAKYMPEGGRIRVATWAEAGHAVIAVRDEGVGIPPEMLQSVFERFVQVEATRSRADGGLGIGLSVVKAVVDMHGGSVEARSEGAGKGSEFVVRLPLRLATPEAEPRPASAQPSRA